MSDSICAYPILLTGMHRVHTIVIGGGAVGERKVAGLLDAKANICLISPQATARLQSWAEQGRIQWLKRSYQPGDLESAWLVVAATDQREINAQVATEAQQRGILCNVADAPAEGNFHVPAVYRGKAEIIAVSTCAGTPKRAIALRNQISEWLKRNEIA